MCIEQQEKEGDRCNRCDCQRVGSSNENDKLGKWQRGSSLFAELSAVTTLKVTI